MNHQAEGITLDGAAGFFMQGRSLPADAGPITSGPMGEDYYDPSLLAWYRDGVWTALEGSSGIPREEFFALARELEAADAR